MTGDDTPAIATRLTERFGLRVPLVLAPMALVAGGALAAAVSRAGGLGLIGGGYAGHLGGEPDLGAEWRRAGEEARRGAVGIGFIAWALAGREDVLAAALARRPRALFLSFPRGPSDLDGPARAGREAGVPVIVQVQTLEGARLALDRGVDVLVAQGTEAGGHGGARATLPLVPEVADLVAARAPDTLVVAAGGIADGRGLASVLLLGADGAVVGSRLWASVEALTPDAHVARAIGASGDGTVRTDRIDRARGLAWPPDYSYRVLRNAFADEVVREAPPDGSKAERYARARAAGDMDVVPAVAGEAVGLIGDRPSAGEIVGTMARDAARRLRMGAGMVGG